jgi:hypothetical protein
MTWWCIQDPSISSVREGVVEGAREGAEVGTPDTCGQTRGEREGGESIIRSEYDMDVLQDEVI